MTGSTVWVHSHPYGRYLLLDVDRATVVNEVTLPTQPLASVAGWGRWIRGRLCAWFVHPKSQRIVIQIGARQFPLAPDTRVLLDRRFSVLTSRLTIWVSGTRKVRIRSWNAVAFAYALIDPAYDELDASVDDFLVDLADIANSTDRQQWILEHADPTGHPNV